MQQQLQKSVIFKARQVHVVVSFTHHVTVCPNRSSPSRKGIRHKACMCCHGARMWERPVIRNTILSGIPFCCILQVLGDQREWKNIASNTGNTYFLRIQNKKWTRCGPVAILGVSAFQPVSQPLPAVVPRAPLPSSACPAFLAKQTCWQQTCWQLTYIDILCSLPFFPGAASIFGFFLSSVCLCLPGLSLIPTIIMQLMSLKRRPWAKSMLLPKPSVLEHQLCKALILHLVFLLRNALAVRRSAESAPNGSEERDEFNSMKGMWHVLSMTFYCYVSTSDNLYRCLESWVVNRNIGWYQQITILISLSSESTPLSIHFYPASKVCATALLGFCNLWFLG